MTSLPARRGSSGHREIVVLGMFSTFGPLSLDLYLPALPQLADDLGTTTSTRQLSITACLLGLAVGQLFAGPLSDRLGRRRPLVVGLVYLLTSAACALAPSIAVLLLLRLLQGLAGAAELVIARAVAGPLLRQGSGGRLLPVDPGLGPGAGAALSSGLAAASMFAYIAGATFVLQRIYGMSAQGFSFVFGVNSLGIMTMGQLAARLVRRWSATRVLALGLMLNLLGALALAATVLTDLGLAFLVGSLLVMVSAVGLVFPTSTALALADYPHQAGTAASLLGLCQYLAGAAVAPLVGIAGAQTAVPLGVVALSASAGASLVFAILVVPASLARQRGAGLA